MRILLVCHHRLNREQGGPSVFLSLADEFRRLGHEVTTFDRDDAARQSGMGPRAAAARGPFRLDTLREFSLRARAFVEQHASRFDVVEALLGDLPYSKRELGFDGLLVGRAVGLFSIYQRAWRQLDRRYPRRAAAARREQALASRHGRWAALPRRLRAAAQARIEAARQTSSMRRCDLINLANAGEREYVDRTFGLGRKCVVLPYGLSDETREALARAAQPSRVRVAATLVAFIGAWVPTKGAWDWSEILLRTKARVPAARFRFLGTSGYADGRPQRVLSDLGRAAADWIEVVPHFPRDQLPGYLAGATIGAFPSHVEGFGIAVLEKLAAGLPTVAYDIPSLREVIAGVDPTWLVPPGAIDAFVERIVALLGLDQDGHARASLRCREVACQWRWPDIAARTVQEYQARLAC